MFQSSWNNFTFQFLVCTLESLSMSGLYGGVLFNVRAVRRGPFQCQGCTLGSLCVPRCSVVLTIRALRVSDIIQPGLIAAMARIVQLLVKIVRKQALIKDFHCTSPRHNYCFLIGNKSVSLWVTHFVAFFINAHSY